VVVWRIKESIEEYVEGEQPQKIATLRDHTAAVTCVKWKNTQLGELLVSSSDDRSFHYIQKKTKEKRNRRRKPLVWL